MSADWFESLIQHPQLLPASKRSSNGGEQLLAVLQQYRITEQLASEDLAVQQRMLLLALAQHCAAQSPHFANRLTAAGLAPPA